MIVRICQKVIDKLEKAEWLGVGKLIDSGTGSGEFGQTGIL